MDFTQEFFLKQPDSPDFTCTRWSMVLQARDGDEGRSARALEYFCTRYWYPLYAYVRRKGSNAQDAEDIVQAFMASLIERKIFQQADRDRSKLRAFLLHNLKYFLLNLQQRESAQKRGGGRRPLSLDAAWAEERYRVELVDSVSPDKQFDRQWALVLLEKVLEDLGAYYRAELGKEDLFESLKAALTGEGMVSYAEIAQRFEMKENSVRVEVKRLRERYRKRLVAAIADTVGSKALVEDEKQYLLTLFQP